MSDIEFENNPIKVCGIVRWFNNEEGYGFIRSDADGPEIMLHKNTLNDFGLSVAIPGSRIEAHAQKSSRGWKAIQVLEINAPAQTPSAAEVSSLPVVPARVRWFHSNGYYGFATVFGHPEDVFIQSELLRKSGFGTLHIGEAVGLKVVTGPRGLVAADLVPWPTNIQSNGRYMIPGRER